MGFKIQHKAAALLSSMSESFKEGPMRLASIRSEYTEQDKPDFDYGEEGYYDEEEEEAGEEE